MKPVETVDIAKAYEDVKRHLEDWQINSLRVIVARNGRLETIKSKDIKVCAFFFSG